MVAGIYLWVPPGFAWGFVATQGGAGPGPSALSPAAGLMLPYACTGLYKKMTPDVHAWTGAVLNAWAGLPAAGVWATATP